MTYEDLLACAPRLPGLAFAASALQVLAVLAFLAGGILGLLAAMAMASQPGSNAGGVLAGLVLMGPALSAVSGGVVLWAAGTACGALRSMARDAHVNARASVSCDGGYMPARARLALRKGAGKA